MDINGWLTVITVFTAIFALVPRQELILSFHRSRSVEKWSIFILIIAVIPYLILFPKLANRSKFFRGFYVEWGVSPSTLAFLLFYFAFWLIIIRLLKPQKASTDETTIKYFVELLSKQPFEEFFGLFTKYTSTKEIDRHWNAYTEIMFHPKFVRGILIYKTSFLLQFWSKFSTEEDFQSIFRLFLDNEQSAYYSEIREHWNSSSLLGDKPFLNTVLHSYLVQSIDNGVLIVLSDYVISHLQKEHGATSIYNQHHYYSRISENEGFELPLYYHILFVGFLYSTAIQNGVDISTLSKRYTNMQSIYSNMIDKMIDNLVVNPEDELLEYPTNYHWLIGRIFSVNLDWLTSFSQRYFSPQSSYIDFIPFSFSRCMAELFKGFERKKIKQDFINRMLYYYVLSDYLNPTLSSGNDNYGLNKVMKLSIEQNIIECIPNEHLEPVLEFALNEKYALHYYNLVKGEFRFVRRGELKMLNRLRALLVKRQII